MKNKSKVFRASLILVLVSLLTLFEISGTFALGNDNSVSGDSVVSIEISEIEDEVILHSDLQKQYLNDSMESVLNYVSGNQENSIPSSVMISWNTTIDETYQKSENINVNDLVYKIYISKESNLNNSYCYETNECSCTITNLEINTTYYFKVELVLENKSFESSISSFTTERNGPRFLFVDGVTNVRDIGGYTTLNGDVVRQGMLIRSGKLHNRDKSAVVTSDGITELTEKLGVKTEIDLRKASDGENGNVSESVLGHTVAYYALPMDYSGNLLEGDFTEDNVGSLRKLFEILSDEDNYPIIYHCVIGTDRTGMVSYLLEALFGMSENDILRDYLLSNFGNINETRSLSSISTKFHRVIKNYDGKTLQEKTYRYLNEVVGVPADQLDEVIRINVIKKSDNISGSEIASEEDFMNMNPNEDYYLSKDITITQSYAEEFTGTLNGNNHTITARAPLFNKTGGTIKNLTLEGEITDNGSMVGTLAREATGSMCIGVTNRAALICTSNDYAGGIIGCSTAKATFINCKNYASITSEGLAAGIICQSNGDLTLESCLNYGEIHAKKAKTSNYAGGIVARSNGGLMISNCSNHGTVTASAKHIGGICGYAAGENLMKTFISCSNHGMVICKSDSKVTQVYHGGIVGYVYGSNSFCTLSYCKNYGEIVSENTEGVSLSGICGYVNSAQIIINNCTNKGVERADSCNNAVFYHLLFNKGKATERFIHDNDIWKYDNVAFTIDEKGTFVIPHEMTVGDWILSNGNTSGNKVLWVSPVTGFSDEEIIEKEEFSNRGIWHYYCNDEQGKVYLEIENHNDIFNNTILPKECLLNPGDDTKSLTIFDLIEPNAVYYKQ